MSVGYSHCMEGMTTRVVYNQKHMDPLEALIDVDTIAEVSKLIYPFGTTLKIQAPSRPIVVTDSSTIPFQQPVMAVNDAKSLLVLGSCRCVDDGYLDQNSALIAVLVKWLASEYKFEQQCEVHYFSINNFAEDFCDYRLVNLNPCQTSSNLRRRRVSASKIPSIFHVMLRDYLTSHWRHWAHRLWKLLE